MVMQLKPDLVLPLELAGDGAERKFKVSGLRKGWVKSQRKWTSVTQDTGVGDPSASSQAKGERFFNDCCKEISGFFIELGKTPNDKLYE